MRCGCRFYACVLLFSCIFLLTGCETIKRKFTRKRKQVENKENVVIVPRDYNEHPFPPDVLYKQHFAYWKSWNQDLIESLTDRYSYKRIISSANQSIANLKKMSSYLMDEKAKGLDVYIEKFEKIEKEMKEFREIPEARMRVFRYKIGRIYSCVNRDYDITRVKNFLKGVSQESQSPTPEEPKPVASLESQKGDEKVN